MTEPSDPTEREDQYRWERREGVLYRTQLSALYHRKRERFLAFWDRATKAVAVIAGSAAFANLGGPEAVKWAAAIIAVTSTLALVFGLAEQARRHSDLARQFLDLEARVLRQGESDFTEKHLNQWDAEVREIESAEPPALGALVVACQNELAQARGDSASIHPLAWWQRATMHLRDFPAARV